MKRIGDVPLKDATNPRVIARQAARQRSADRSDLRSRLRLEQRAFDEERVRLQSELRKLEDEQ